MKKKLWPVALLALTLVLASCGDTASSSISSSDSSGNTSSETSSTSSTLPPTPVETWDEMELSTQHLYLNGYDIPYIDLSDYIYSFIPYQGMLSLEVQEATYALVEEYLAILEEVPGIIETPSGDENIVAYDLFEDGLHITFQVYLADEEYYPITEGTGTMCVDVTSRVAVTQYPAETVAAALSSLGITGVTIPDLSSLPSEDYYVTDAAAGYFQIQWTGPNDEVTLEQMAAIFEAANWTEVEEDGYLDPTEQVIAYLAIDATYDIPFITILPYIPPITSVPHEDIKAALTRMGIPYVEIPDYPTAAEYEFVDYSVIGLPFAYLAVYPEATASLEAWTAVFQEEGWIVEESTSEDYEGYACHDATETAEVLLQLDSENNTINVQFNAYIKTYETFPTEEVNEAIKEVLGVNDVTFPDCSSITGTMYLYTQEETAEESAFFQVEWDSLDGNLTEDLIAILEAAGWEYSPTRDGYLDPTGQVIVYVVYYSVNLYESITILMGELAGEPPATSWDANGYREELATIGLTGSLPTLEAENLNEISVNVDDDYGYLDIVASSITGEEVNAYIDTLLANGYEALELTNLNYQPFTVYIHEENNLLLELTYYEEDSTLAISVCDLAYNLGYDSEYIEYYLDLYGTGVSLPDETLANVWCYVDLNLYSYMGLVGVICAGGNYQEAITEELTANGWVVDSTSEDGSLLYGTEDDYSVVLIFEYDAELNATILNFYLPY